MEIFNCKKGATFGRGSTFVKRPSEAENGEGIDILTDGTRERTRLSIFGDNTFKNCGFKSSAIYRRSVSMNWLE